MITSRYSNDRHSSAKIYGTDNNNNKSDRIAAIVDVNLNNSLSPYISQDVQKNAVDLTTARFRMLVNSEDFARPFEAKVDNNLPDQRYSNIDLIIHFSEVAHSGLTDSVVKNLIQGRRLFRRFYFVSTFCKYFDQLISNSPLLMYRLNTNPKPGIWIDKIVQWYPIFPGQSSDGNCSKSGKLAALEQEKMSFLQHLKIEFREILLEYYEVTDHFPNKLLSSVIETLEKHVEMITDRALQPFESCDEICKKCGESFQDKDDLINHHDFNGCKLAPVHRCQCGDIFMTHTEWHNHCVNVPMQCAAFAWHIWRHKRSMTCYSYMCDGCQHIYGGFLKFWHHICHCPFFVAFVTGNCPHCTAQTRLDFYQTTSTQSIISRPHSDRVGIAILRDWAMISNIKFNFKLAIPEEPMLFLE